MAAHPEKVPSKVQELQHIVQTLHYYMSISSEIALLVWNKGAHDLPAQKVKEWMVSYKELERLVDHYVDAHGPSDPIVWGPIQNAGQLQYFIDMVEKTVITTKEGNHTHLGALIDHQNVKAVSDHLCQLLTKTKHRGAPFVPPTTFIKK